MATLVELCDQGLLEKLDLGVDDGANEWRLIYLLPRAANWFANALPSLGSDWQIELSPVEQVFGLVQSYISGKEIVFERQFKPMRHIAKGIWTLKTADVRMFGWYAHKDCFVISAGDLASRIKSFDLYRGYIDQAVTDRNNLALNPPKFIPGADPAHVISNFSIATP